MGVAPVPGAFASDLELAEAAGHDIFFSRQGLFDDAHEVFHSFAGGFS